MDEVPDGYSLDDLKEYLDYVTITWVEGYRLDLWNHFETEGPRTNNHIEGYNRKFNDLLGHHPNIWNFITTLIEEEERMSIRLGKLNAGNLRENTRKKEDIERDLKISKLQTKYLMKKLDLDQYVREIASVMPDIN